MEAIKLLKRLNKETAADVYYSGEFVRDVARRKRSNDISVIVRNLPFKKILSFINSYKKRLHKIYSNTRNSYIRFQLKESKNTVHVHLPQKNGKHSPYYTLNEDARCRDFTINAMYLSVQSMSRDLIIDPVGGLKDIKRRKIKTVRAARYLVKRNPASMIKAVALSAKLRYRIDNNLFYAIKVNHQLVSRVKTSDIRNSLVNILLSHRPSRYFRIMNDSGLLDVVLPELSLCVGVTQNKKYHKYDVFGHSIVACDRVKPDLMLRLAALMHDIGKPETREEITKGKGTRITFYNHEVVSARIAKKVLKRLKFDKEMVVRVPELIYQHMYNYEHEKWSDAAVRRFIRKIDLTEKDLQDLDNLPIFLLRKADRYANGKNLSSISYRQISFQERIKEVFNRSKALNVSDLDIDGNILMKEFKLKAGPTVGHVLNYLLSLVIEDQKLNERQTLINAASDYLSKALK